MTEIETELERIYTSPGPHHPAEIAWLVMQARRFMRENAHLKSEVERLQHDIADLQMLRDEHQMDVMHAFQEGGEDERRKVVAWLRRNPGVSRASECVTAMTPFETADAIERGERRREEER
jgi:hypothetical protein